MLLEEPQAALPAAWEQAAPARSHLAMLALAPMHPLAIEEDEDEFEWEDDDYDDDEDYDDDDEDDLDDYDEDFYDDVDDDEDVED